MAPLFLADVHLGKLARLLRLSGFDVLYHNMATQEELAGLALRENRIVATKNAFFKKAFPQISVCLFESSNSYEQWLQVVEQFQLLNMFQPFSRCLVCNGRLAVVSKESIVSLLPRNTARYYNEFWQCANCRRIYWKGPHYNRMQQLIAKIEQKEH